MARILQSQLFLLQQTINSITLHLIPSNDSLSLWKLKSTYAFLESLAPPSSFSCLQYFLVGSLFDPGLQNHIPAIILKELVIFKNEPSLGPLILVESLPN